MRYVISDIHGEYDLFLRLLEKIKFSQEDTLYVCGDIIDKGKEPLKLLRYIYSMPNARCILGNHEYSFLKCYRAILETSPTNFDSVLYGLRQYFDTQRELLDWDIVDWLDALPAYIEEEDFICVHAAAPLDENGNILPLKDASPEELIYGRKFKEPTLIHNSPKCVFFGHTETSAVCGKDRIIGYKRNPLGEPKTVRDFYKIHLDTGAWHSGVVGCFCIDTLSAVYVGKRE